MHEFDEDGPRSEGPPVVWAGPDLGPALVVLDPTGAAKHADLPATWRRLAEGNQVIWCRLPASRRSLEDVEDVLESLAERRPPHVLLVAAGEACTAAVAMADQFDDMVNHVLLVDPEAGTPESDRVRVIARADGPLPLGHPDVVAGIEAAVDCRADRPLWTE